MFDIPQISLTAWNATALFLFLFAVFFFLFLRHREQRRKTVPNAETAGAGQTIRLTLVTTWYLLGGWAFYGFIHWFLTMSVCDPIRVLVLALWFFGIWVAIRQGGAFRKKSNYAPLTGMTGALFLFFLDTWFLPLTLLLFFFAFLLAGKKARIAGVFEMALTVVFFSVHNPFC